MKSGLKRKNKKIKNKISYIMRGGMYSSFDVAKIIINWCNGNGIPIANLKLQKLLYFAQGEFFKNQKR